MPPPAQLSKKYQRTYIIEGDIREAIRALPEIADVAAGGFPCQDISINGKMEGINGKRSGLYALLVEAVKKMQPKMFVTENVKGLSLKKTPRPSKRFWNILTRLTIT
jgi:DNA (cytosine-5)-methyltransferase 1